MSAFSNIKSQEARLRALLVPLDEPARAKILNALSFAKGAHGTQIRDEGSLYVIHPIRAACTLLELGISAPDVIAAMLLHDVVEDTGIPSEELQKRFGRRTATLVKNVTRVRKLHETEKERRESKIQKFAECLSADQDTRLIKCADMLDNIRSMSLIPEAHPSRKKFARWYTEVEQYSIPIAEKTDKILTRLIREAFAEAKACA